VDPFKSILVDIDAMAPVHPELDRAANLARRSGARLSIVDVLTLPSRARQYLPVDVEEEIVARRREALTRVAGGVTGVHVESKLLAGRPATALVEEVLGSGHDLVVRSRARDLAAPPGDRFGPVDIELLQGCPCPILLVGTESTATAPRILAAVNASTESDVADTLNTGLVELAMRMTELEGGSLTLLHAWVPFSEMMVRRVASEEAFAAYLESARQRATEDFSRLTSSVAGGLAANVRTEVRRGEPEDVIPEFVVAEGIDLVVMGTMARRGLARWLIGNTAERVLRRLPCSVLTVRPDWFASMRPTDPE
jgi:nucleotide-binding universal stress UspA family protein